MTKFYVYENWTIDRARVHKGSCSYCNDGKGVQVADSGRNGKWRGPFVERKTAFDILAKLGRADAGACGKCKP